MISQPGKPTFQTTRWPMRSGPCPRMTGVSVAGMTRSYPVGYAPCTVGNGQLLKGGGLNGKVDPMVKTEIIKI